VSFDQNFILLAAFRHGANGEIVNDAQILQPRGDEFGKPLFRPFRTAIELVPLALGRQDRGNGIFAHLPHAGRSVTRPLVNSLRMIAQGAQVGNAIEHGFRC